MAKQHVSLNQADGAVGSKQIADLLKKKVELEAGAADVAAADEILAADGSFAVGDSGAAFGGAPLSTGAMVGIGLAVVGAGLLIAEASDDDDSPAPAPAPAPGPSPSPGPSPAPIPGPSNNTPLTFTHTDQTDAFTGAAGNDIFRGDSNTVQPGDFIDGQGGTDTANYTLSAALLGTTMSVNATAVEVFNLTSIGSNAATFNTTNVTGATNFNSVKSTSNLKVSGLASTAPTFGMTETGSNFTIEFTDAALAGAADKVSMVLNGVTNTSTVTIGSVSTPNAGVESLSVKTEGAGSRILTLNTVDLESLTVTGDKSFRVSNALGSTGLETVDASGNSGGVRLDFTGNTENMTITGGSGNDRFAMGLSLNGNDKINTGGGNDTVTFDTGTNGALMGVDVLPKNLQISNAETIGIDTRATGAVTTGAAEFDLARVPGATGFILEGGNDLSTAGGTFTIKNFKSGGNLILESDVTGAAGIVIDSPESGLAGKNSDSINIALNQATDQTVANLTISNIETANIAMAGAGKDSIAFTDTGLKTVNITGTAADLTLTNTSNSVTTIDGSATDADLLLAGFGVSAAGATITGGSGDDTLVGNSGQDTIVGGSGNDTITGAGGGDTLTGGGGADRFVFAAGDSKVSALDVITDFATGAGNDQIMVGLAFSALNGVEANAVSGKATLLEAAQEAALYSTNEATVFSFGGQTYFLADMDASGTYTEAGDVLVQLTGVTVSNFVAGNVV